MATPTGQPQVLILKEGTERTRGRDAQSTNIDAAIAVSDAVRSCLGPRGMDKMLVDSLGDVTVTSDGATVLKEIDIKHPAAKMVAEVAKTLSDEVGDGTTTAVVLAGELLKQARALAPDVHPTIIAQGYAAARRRAAEVLSDMAAPITVRERKRLEAVASTAITGKADDALRVQLADIVASAVTAIADDTAAGLEVDPENVMILKKKGESAASTELLQGIALDKERVHEGMPVRVEDARIALLNVALEFRKTEIDAKIKITHTGDRQGFLEQEEAFVRDLVQKVLDAGANVVVCQKGVDDHAQNLLARAGAYAVRRVKKSDMEKLARATGGRLVQNLDDLSPNDLGKARLVDERRVGGDRVTFVTGCKNPRSVTILVRAATEQKIDEIERALDDALRATAAAAVDGKVLPGGAAPEAEVALALRKHATTLSGRDQLAVLAFAKAVEAVPRTLAENAGASAIDALVALRNAHERGEKTAGLSAADAKPIDMVREGVLEPLRVKRQAFHSATEAAILILRIDDVIAAKELKSEGKEGAGAH
ncbi:MAG TPA: thermosome subunit alpha [Candidatus Thermoplasmatota archaeon]|nr:thermosome subunit alpha [Candidatus Thermoplasmatota archaeon]